MHEETSVNIRWFDLLRDFFGLKLTKADAMRWSEMLKADLKGVTEGEVIEAMKWARHNWKRRSKYLPEYTEVCDMIKAHRGVKSRGRGIFTPGAARTITPVWTEDGLHHLEYGTVEMADLKRMLNSSPPPDVAWEIICTPADSDQCKELQQYCDTHGIAYQRFHAKVPEVRHGRSLRGVANE